MSERSGKALKLPEARKGSHLYDPDKPMSGWVLIPNDHSDEWPDFALKANEYVKSLLKL